MNQAIRSSWMAAVAMFALIFGAISYVQVIGADDLNANPWNQRAVLASFCNERGSIIVAGKPVVESVPGTESCAFQRKYNQPELYAGITGYFSKFFGSSGLEQSMGETLAGNSDQLFLDRMSQMFLGKEPKGASVELTLDPALQQLAMDLIPEGQRGSIVVTNPKTGAILAMASKPTYDPNLIATHDKTTADANYAQLLEIPGINLNQSVSGPTGNLLSPGSVFKLIDTAAALNSGKYNKDSELPNPSSLPLPGSSASLPNYAGGNCNVRETASFAFALEQSCNTPFASIALDLGQDAIREQAQKFGFGQDFGNQLNLPSATSVFPEDLDQAQLAQSSVGQRDVKATPLQINTMTAAIANGGVQMKPNLVEAVRAPDLRVINEPKPETLRTSTTQPIANQITEWMTSAVDNGIARGAAVPGVKVAGKTGTAELGDSGLNNSWFTGFAPANDPQVAVTIVMESVDVLTGAQLTSPNAKKIFEAVLNK
ncbi:peptidoglycan D,D-transpeptidase FtsI family protein [Paenarthrobacter aurescens]|uniref:Cell division protein FtsI n=1 Tax=Paenarthrobacter aurescens TaxID=43663 RepID=A0A4Y3NDX1_PAEAU|nr:penicillin-binding protein 2 [Paenarthrobacter aurescens]MDO6141724.1 penicillin-binding protein 2 [Paenarthrobacter aurescens]MDO6149487.1 penicillin-binding protein 2 [Paenarthrobacter aurescens]MDO6156773.1 penicillin-binding protein 2 [Paenarthrobacter aurescens]MDO6160759.1 penicillin-binding protein 2 [Paenarthrobacter aurescens]GEB18625.1 cell division protein FtsI [Paenarthrobacter aurescens]